LAVVAVTAVTARARVVAIHALICASPSVDDMPGIKLAHHKARVQSDLGGEDVQRTAARTTTAETVTETISARRGDQHLDFPPGAAQPYSIERGLGFVVGRARQWYRSDIEQCVEPTREEANADLIGPDVNAFDRGGKTLLRREGFEPSVPLERLVEIC